MTNSTREYRCTRNAPYDDPGCPGHTDPSSRQGYYIRAKSENEALAEMNRRFPADTAGFTVTLWR